MVGTLLMALGLVLCLEGLVMALAPSRLEDLLETLRAMPIEARRLLGLIAVVAGAALFTLAHLLAG
ncbi:DUF2065 domain-containing protein [Palleronia rufa]|uniref:DUF2065 domain-containing protein n=1 Tax=Palleronia rufa TaxID=1530186 RepID=UPI00389943C1